MTTVFLSYARGDDVEPYDPAMSFAARLHRDLTAAGFDVWFDRVSMPARGLTFHQEIRDAIAASDRLLLIVAPNAVASDYVRQEWQFAWFDADKVVTTILRSGDYPLAIPELALLHAEDFRDDLQYDRHLQNLIRTLSDPAPRMGQLIGVPSLPAHYLSRSDLLMPLRDAVRAGLDSTAPLGGTAVHQKLPGIIGRQRMGGMAGMGGIGKSVLACLLAHDRKVREAFPDGIVWVALGSLPNVPELLRQVHRDLGGDGAFEHAHEGKTKLKEMLAAKSVLLILDDAWRRADVEAFDVLGPTSRALITTRDAQLLTSLGGTPHLIELLSDDESLRLLAVTIGTELSELPPEASRLIRECGRLPLAVALAGGMLAAGQAWTKLLTAFQRHKLEFFQDDQRDNQHHDLLRTIEVSVQTLSPDEQSRLIELGVFPEDEIVPEPAIATLWEHTEELDDLDTSSLLLKLKQRSLIQMVTPKAADSNSVSRIGLHDLIHDYCLLRAKQQLGSEPALHEQLLAAYRSKSPDGWPSGPHDGYFFSHLRDHLIAIGHASELADLLHELRWLETKNEAGLTFDLPFDFQTAIKALPMTDSRWRILNLLDEALRRDIHFIARHTHDYPQAMFQCFWNCCWWYDSPDVPQHYVEPAEGWKHRPHWNHDGPKLCDMLTRWRAQFEQSRPGFPWLRAGRPPVIHLGTAQRAILRGHEGGGGVMTVSYSPDGTRIVSGSDDHTLRVWDAASGAQLAVLRGHENGVMSVSYSPDGTRIVSGSDDHTLRVWDAASGAELAVLRGHENGIMSVSYSPDGTRIVSGSRDRTLRVWDAASGAELAVLRGHENGIMSVSYSPNGTRIVSGSWDQTLRVWDAASGAELAVRRGDEGGVTSVTYSPDGTRIVSGAYDRTLRVWHASSGVELAVLRGHEEPVKCVSYSPDGTRIVSGSDDQTLCVWDAASGTELAVLRGHENLVLSASYSPDGTRIVSGAYDYTVRVWDAAGGAELAVVRGHENWVKTLLYSPDGMRIVSGSADQTLRVWNAVSGAELAVLRGHEHNVWDVSYSSDGTRIASGSWDKTVRVWDAASGAELTVLRGHEDGVMTVSYSPDGTRIVSGADDKTLRVWDVASGAELAVLRGHEGGVMTVSYSPDGTRIVSGADDDTLRVWDATSGAELAVLRGHTFFVRSVNYSPDGTRIVSGSGDHTIRVWDAISGAELAVLHGHEDSVTDVSYSPHGTRIVSSAQEGTRIWDAQTFQCLEIIRGCNDGTASSIGSRERTWRALRRGGETIVKSSSEGSPTARFPTQIQGTTTSPCGRAWAGVIGNALQILHLEGVP
jgi:WD40 repeat protein